MTAQNGDRTRPPGALWAVVLAGGTSRRFGSDKLSAKLSADLGGLRLLERVVRGLPEQARPVIVGPVRAELDLGRPIAYVREAPPGGGPAAGMVAGLRAVLESEAGADDAIVVLPGDAPAAGSASTLLLDALVAGAGASAVVGVDAAGREQPLQLALRPAAARRLVEAAGPEAGHGASARALVLALDPDLLRVRLPEQFHADIDTQADLERWRA